MSKKYEILIDVPTFRQFRYVVEGDSEKAAEEQGQSRIKDRDDTSDFVEGELDWDQAEVVSIIEQ